MRKRKEENLKVNKGFRTAFKILKVTIKIKPSLTVLYFTGALTEIGSSLTAMYASAKLASLLANFVATGSSVGVWKWLWIDVIAGIFVGLGFLAMKYARDTMYFKLIQWSVSSYINTLSRIDIADFYDKNTRNLINKVGGGYTWQLANLSNNCLDVIYSVLRFIAITVVVSQIIWWLVPLIAVFLIPTLIAERKLAKTQWFLFEEKGDQRHIFWGLESLIKQVKGQMELRSTQANNYINQKLNNMNKEFYDEQESKYKKASRFMAFSRIIETSGTTIGAVVLLRQLLSRGISLDKYFFLSGALLRVSSSLNNIFGLISSMQATLLFCGSYFELISLEPTIKDKPDAMKIKAGSTPTIKFENLSFKYPGSDNFVFNDLSLEIKTGEHLAIVGENGAGKSTLIKLLLRFYLPTSGRILINDTDLNDIEIESWYEHISTLFQEFNHYPLPIGENIEIGRSKNKPDKKKLLEAAKFSNVYSFVDKYEHGYETVLDSSFEKGVEPSGGQWQRVGLARSFYRDGSVLVLDEPTSAIDAKAEYDIFNNIFEQYKNKTTIIISHRFSTVRRADRIVVLDEGKILEEGTHQSLMKNNGLYSKLFNHQAEGYRE